MYSPFEQYGYLCGIDKAEFSALFPMGADPDNSPAVGGDCPDLMLVSSDQAFYHVDRLQLLCISENAFAGLLIDKDKPITLTEPASVLNLLINIIYGISCLHLAPSLETIEAVLDALVKYGISPSLNASPGQPVYQLLLLHAPHRPIDAYALAGHHGLDDAAAAISGHLLAYDTSELSDALVTKMGPVYFCRLLCLHQNRLSALKSIVLRPPGQHPPTPACDEGAPSRTDLATAWAFALAQLAWDMSPAISTNTLRRTFENTDKPSVCCKCHAMLETRIGEVCKAWAAVKRTI